MVVVTGATGGIGRAVCLRLAQDGYDIVVQYASNHEKAEALQREISDLGRTATILQVDLTDDTQQIRFIETVQDLLHTDSQYSLAGLVNNAAKLLGPSFENATTEHFEAYFALNTRAPFFLAQGLSRLMSEGGSIVNVSSVATKFSSSGDIIYAMSKAALEALTFHAAEVLATRRIRINTVLPGFTDNGHQAFRDPRARGFMSSFAALGDVAQPETVAEAVAFLISNSSARTTGSLLDVSGGSALGRRAAEGSITSLLG